jgi:putative DNA methylase
MRDEAEKRIGHLYPKATLPDDSQATVIAWLWARTVRSPDPAAKGAMVPLVSSFVISTKDGNKAWVEPIIDSAAPYGWRFEVHVGVLSKEDEEKSRRGTKGDGRGAAFSCILTGALISGDHIKSEGVAGRIGARLMALVAEGHRARIYLSPNAKHEAAAMSSESDARVKEAREHDLGQPVPAKLTGGTCFNYGLDTFGKLFTARQLMALTTFSDLVNEARERVLADAAGANFGHFIPVEQALRHMPTQSRLTWPLWLIEPQIEIVRFVAGMPDLQVPSLLQGDLHGRLQSGMSLLVKRYL